MTISRPLKDIWRERKDSAPETVLFVKIGKFYHLFNGDVDRVYPSGLLLDKHIIYLAPTHTLGASLNQMWAIPETIINTFLTRLDEEMPELVYECGTLR